MMQMLAAASKPAEQNLVNEAKDIWYKCKEEWVSQADLRLASPSSGAAFFRSTAQA